MTFSIMTEPVRFNAMKIVCASHCLNGKNKPYESIFIISSNFMQRPKYLCHIPKATSISHIRKQIATDSDNYTPNYIESKMFRYKLNTSHSRCDCVHRSFTLFRDRWTPLYITPTNHSHAKPRSIHVLN